MEQEVVHFLRLVVGCRLPCLSEGDIVVKVAEILASVEHIKEGWSEAKAPKEWKETFDKRREAISKPSDPPSPTRLELGKLQDQGLSRNMTDPIEAKIVGIKK